MANGQRFKMKNPWFFLCSDCDLKANIEAKVQDNRHLMKLNQLFFSDKLMKIQNKQYVFVKLNAYYQLKLHLI